MRSVYPAKVLLLGEHTVLRGGRGLAVPYPACHLQWATGTDPDDRLQDFAAYLRRAAFPIDHARFQEALAAGWYLRGNIPTGYGLGSSGAVCAAVYDRFGTEGETPELRELRHLLAGMEGFFHGSSSGTDPLVAYRQEPILLEEAGGVAALALPANWADGWFLLDTGITRQAGPLIERFLAAHDADPDAIRTGWQEPADEAIAALVGGWHDELYAAVTRVSDFQMERFPDFIPPDYREVWDGGEAYRLKICGAGGGGMLLGLARDTTRVRELFGSDVQWLAV